MKKSVYLSILIALFPAPLYAVACKSEPTPPPTTPPTYFTPLSSPTIGEDFDFAPLPPKRGENGEFWDVSQIDISSINNDKKLIAFTFDDSPASTLESILSVFASFNEQNPNSPASATLFCNGRLISENALPNLYASLTLGWELGNHTTSHPDITSLPLESVLQEVAETEVLLNSIDGQEKHLFRPPFGRINEEVKNALSVPIIDWTIDTLDWTGISEEEIYDTVFSQKFAGAIVLMHDGYPNTVAALKRLLPDLKDAGYQVCSVSKMAKAHNCPLKNGSSYIRARKRENG